MHTPNQEQRRLLTLLEVAEVLGTGERMARRIVSERRVPVVKVGRHVRVWSDDLDAYLESNTEPATRAAKR
ncbi:helix-turn-helix domain-containing protein [Agrococcus sp. KRD186]|uniref:helix-turn-helix domain-containing protein n=1 Tax=Agrococcus sp. KRD186 TaxID=2729730 RepID=UPI0019CF84FD|nr:helix-turn-helix domain-containing protein [Agrococcus sp. KRD186]